MQKEIAKILSDKTKCSSYKVAAVLTLLNFAVEVLQNSNDETNMGSIAMQARSMYEKTKKYLD